MQDLRSGNASLGNWLVLLLVVQCRVVADIVCTVGAFRVHWYGGHGCDGYCCFESMGYDGTACKLQLLQWRRAKDEDPTQQQQRSSFCFDTSTHKDEKRKRLGTQVLVVPVLLCQKKSVKTSSSHAKQAWWLERFSSLRDSDWCLHPKQGSRENRYSFWFSSSITVSCNHALSANLLNCQKSTSQIHWSQNPSAFQPALRKSPSPHLVYRTCGTFSTRFFSVREGVKKLMEYTMFFDALDGFSRLLPVKVANQPLWMVATSCLILLIS